MKKLLSITALGFLLTALVLAVAPAWADDSVDQKIKALEQELNRLKGDQMELKKEATAAAAALPSFSYRPGNGVRIEAADKAWSIQLSHEADFRMPFEAGKDHVGRTNAEVMGRRFRQEWEMCLNNCFYVLQSRLDLDGFATNSELQRGQIEFHLEQINPWLPTIYTGMDIEARIGPFNQGGSATGAQGEYDLLRRNNGFNTGRTGTGVGVRWDEIPLIPMLGIPGRGDANIQVGSIGAGDDGTSVSSDRKDVSVYFRIDPFSQVKNDWISGFSYSIGAWFCNRDGRVGAQGCDRNRVRDDGPGGRQTLFDSGAFPVGSGGQAQYVTPGIQWRYGPYTLRAVIAFMNYNIENPNGDSRAGGVGLDNKARNFLIGHDIFLWSPKGLLTGSASVPGSVLAGYHFERNDYSCGHTATLAMCAAGAEFSRNRIIRNEWDLWYFFMPSKSIGVNWYWYDASNLRSGDNQAQANLLGKAGSRTVAGKGGEWLDATISLRINF